MLFQLNTIYVSTFTSLHSPASTTKYQKCDCNDLVNFVLKNNLFDLLCLLLSDQALASPPPTPMPHPPAPISPVLSYFNLEVLAHGRISQIFDLQT